MKKKYVWIIILSALAGCSSSPPALNGDTFYKAFPLPSGNGPVPPDPSEPGLAIPGPGPVRQQLGLGANAPIPTPRDNPRVSIMSVSGAVLTVWSRLRQSWLWGYTPWDSNNFGDLRNWQIQPGKTPGSVRFINQGTGSCMTDGVDVIGIKGFIHSACDSRLNIFDFRLLPTLNGNVYIQSVSTKSCIQARFLDRTTSSPYAFEILPAACPEPGEENIELQWSISEPLMSAYAAIAKPEILPFPALPLAPGIDPSPDDPSKFPPLPLHNEEL
ncbi:toxin [Salmonella enterica]|nr:toxin [Salmonella enterica]